MAQTQVPGDQWVELIPETLEDDYTLSVEGAPVYVSPGDKPARPVAGIEIKEGATHSGELDRGVALWGRSQLSTPAQVRVVPNLRLNSTQRTVDVFTTVETQSFNRQPRRSLPEDQSRETFAITASSKASTFPFVQDPITPGEGEVELYHVESQTKTPYTPDAGRNLEVTKIRSSVDVNAVIRFYVNTELVFKAFLDSGGYKDIQQAGGFELGELVDDLDGTNSAKVTLENLDSSSNLEGTVFFRTVEEAINE